MSTNLITPINQFIYASQFYQNQFTFDNAPDDVRISRYLNNFLKIIGNDIVIRGGKVSSLIIEDNTLTVTIGKGKLIQDITLIPFPDFSLDKSITNYTGDSISNICIKLKNALDDNNIGALVTTTSDSVVVSDNQTGQIYPPININTGFTIGTIQEGSETNNAIVQINPLSSKDIFYDDTYFPHFILSTTTGYYCIYFSFGSLTPPIAPSYSGVTNIEVSLSKAAYAVVYTDFKYSSATRNTLIDPCPFTFKLDLYDSINKTFINPINTWDEDKNRIVISVHDLATLHSISSIVINDTYHYEHGHNRGNYFVDQPGSAWFLMDGNLDRTATLDCLDPLDDRVYDGGYNPYFEPTADKTTGDLSGIALTLTDGNIFLGNDLDGNLDNIIGNLDEVVWDGNLNPYIYLNG